MQHLLRHDNAVEQQAISFFASADAQILLILVGLPGSGKTTLARAIVDLNNAEDGLAAPHLTALNSPDLPIVQGRKWVRASQDDAPSHRRQECETQVRDALLQGHNVIVDRVGFDRVQRSHFIRLVARLRLPIRPKIYAITLSVSRITLVQRLLIRPEHPTLTTPELAISVLDQMARQFDPPRAEYLEGFDRIYVLAERDQPAAGVWSAAAVKGLLVSVEHDGQTEPARGSAASQENSGGRSGRGRGWRGGGHGRPHVSHGIGHRGLNAPPNTVAPLAQSQGMVLDDHSRPRPFHRP